MPECLRICLPDFVIITFLDGSVSTGCHAVLQRARRWPLVGVCQRRDAQRVWKVEQRHAGCCQGRDLPHPCDMPHPQA
jgi:hypothetical protein